MKFQIFSDLHLELLKKIPNIPIYAKNLILAGDITNLNSKLNDSFFNTLSNNFEKIIYVPGNHEFYFEEDYQQVNQYYENYFKKFKNIYYLNNKMLELNNYLIIGSPLWSHPLLSARFTVNDFKKIYTKQDNLLKNITLNEFYNLNNNSIKFLTESLDKTKQTIVITHFAPVINQTFNETKYKNVNNYFTNNLENLIEDNKQIKYWIFGHSHYQNRFKLNNTELITNCIGYPYELEYNFNCVIDIE